MQTHAAGVELLGYRYEVGELAATEVEIRISHCGMPLRTYGVSPASRIGVVGIGELGYLALQLARVFGAEVTGAFSHEPCQRS
jgi:threonine dehydrogenase-like Zn-dependent dehydrogenase